MKPTLSRPAANNFFLFIFGSFWPNLATTHLLRLWCLIVAVRGTSAAMIKRQSQLPSQLATELVQGRSRHKRHPSRKRAPAIYSVARLSQFRCELRPQSCDCGQKVLLDWVSSLCFGF